MKTPEDVEALKRSYLRDPFDGIEDEEGFEAYRDELLAFRREQEALQAERERLRVEQLLASNALPLTARDHFAMAALAGRLACETEDWNASPSAHAHWAYAQADAMLLARIKPL